MPTATVILPPLLRERIGQQMGLHIEGATVREIITNLEHGFPGIGFYLCYETGELIWSN